MSIKVVHTGKLDGQRESVDLILWICSRRSHRESVQSPLGTKIKMNGIHWKTKYPLSVRYVSIRECYQSTRFSSSENDEILKKPRWHQLNTFECNDYFYDNHGICHHFDPLGYADQCEIHSPETYGKINPLQPFRNGSISDCWTKWLKLELD